jgi:hypothetical protein
MPISNKPWSDVKESDYPNAGSYCAASLIDLNESGKSKAKGQCHLPVYEPGGALNRAGVHAAAAALAGARGGLKVPPAAKRAAARKLLRLYGELKEEAPESIRRLAR